MRPIILALTLALPACGSTLKGGHDSGNQSPTVKDDSDLTELTSSSPTAAPSLVSAFGITDGNTAGGFVAFYTGHRYFSGVIEALSDVSVRAMGVVGTYDDSSGTIVPTGKKTTCKSWLAAAKADGPATIAGSVAGDSLIITRGATTVELPRYEVETTKPTAIVVEWGCFDLTSGGFTAQAWSNI